MEQIFITLNDIWENDDTTMEKIENTQTWMQFELNNWISYCNKSYSCFNLNDSYYLFKKKYTPRIIKIKKPNFTTYKENFYYIKNLLKLISCDFERNHFE
jgi:hypothetical protein